MPLSSYFLDRAEGSAFEGSGAEGGALEGSVPEEGAACTQAFTHVDCASGFACLPAWEALREARCEETSLKP